MSCFCLKSNQIYSHPSLFMFWTVPIVSPVMFGDASNEKFKTGSLFVIMSPVAPRNSSSPRSNVRNVASFTFPVLFAITFA